MHKFELAGSSARLRWRWKHSVLPSDVTYLHDTSMTSRSVFYESPMRHALIEGCPNLPHLGVRLGVPRLLLHRLWLVMPSIFPALFGISSITRLYSVSHNSCVSGNRRKSSLVHQTSLPLYLSSHLQLSKASHPMIFFAQNVLFSIKSASAILSYS